MKVAKSLTDERNIQILHAVQLDHLTDLTADSLTSWMKKSKGRLGAETLDDLYELTGTKPEDMMPEGLVLLD